MSCTEVSKAPVSSKGPWYLCVKPNGMPASVSIFGNFAKYATYKYIEHNDPKYELFETYAEAYNDIYKTYGECIIHGYITNNEFIAYLVVKNKVLHPVSAKEMCEYVGLPHVKFVACVESHKNVANVLAISENGVYKKDFDMFDLYFK